VCSPHLLSVHSNPLRPRPARLANAFPFSADQPNEFDRDAAVHPQTVAWETPGDPIVGSSTVRALINSSPPSLRSGISAARPIPCGCEPPVPESVPRHALRH